MERMGMDTMDNVEVIDKGRKSKILILETKRMRRFKYKEEKIN